MSELTKRNEKSNQPGRKLRKQVKLQFVRTLMVKNPDWDRYGYNREVARVFFEKTGQRMGDSEICKLIREVRENWEQYREVGIQKQQLLDMWKALYATATTVYEKAYCLTGMQKLSGAHLTIKHEGIPRPAGTKTVQVADEAGVDLTYATNEELDQLEQLLGAIEERNVKTKGIQPVRHITDGTGGTDDGTPDS